MPTMTEQPVSDVARLLQTIARLGGANRGQLEEALRVHAWSTARVGAALNSAASVGLTQNGETTAILEVSARGRALLESGQRRAAEPPPVVDERPAFERYRSAAAEALPAWLEQRRLAQLEAEEKRSQAATMAWGTALGPFRNLPTFDADWARVLDPHPSRGLLALMPKFAVVGGAFVRVEPVQGGVVLRGSVHEDPVWLADGSSPSTVMAALGLALRLDVEDDAHLVEVGRERSDGVAS